MWEIRHISAPLYDSEFFATAEFESRVTVWSFAARRKIVEFESGLDFGGRRLAVVPSPKPAVAVGAWKRWGISLYDAVTGNLLWQRKDVKQVQHVRPIPEGESYAVGVGRQEGSYLILDRDSGRTVASFRGVKDVYASPACRFAIRTSRDGGIELCSLDDWSTVWKRPPESFAVLDVGITPDAVACSWVGSKVRCFHMTGEPAWEWSPAQASHVLWLAHSQSARCWVGVVYPYEKGGPKSLIVWDDAGTAISETQIGEAPEVGFFKEGRYIVTSEGRVRSVPTGECVWEFEGSSGN